MPARTKSARPERQFLQESTLPVLEEELKNKLKVKEYPYRYCRLLSLINVIDPKKTHPTAQYMKPYIYASGVFFYA